MAGNKFFNNQNIFVESDYENIIVIDPNKVVDPDGTVHERLVNHEEMVIYANLEAKVLPRTKLAVGNNYEDTIQNIRVGAIDGDLEGKINFLKPKGKNYLDDSWTNQLTGDGALGGDGINQTKVDWDENTIRTGDGKTETRYVQRRTTLNQQDTQLLGITNISIKMNTSYVPQVTIQMVDVQGRILFEQGENSPYSAFMQMPYPLFTLTIKGYFGKAVRYELMLKDFNARFDSSDGNYQITTNYIARTYALLSDIQVNSLFALPRMYITESTISNGNTINPTTSITTGENNRLIEPVTINSSRGYSKIREVYSTYKSKGLIEDDFPEITINEMLMRLDNFEKYVMEFYGQEDMTVLSDIQEYKNTINEYRNTLYGVFRDNWYIKYIDNSKKYVLNKLGNPILNVFKGELSRQEKKDALAELDGIFEKYNKKLNENKTFGVNGSCEIGGEKITDCAINVEIGRVNFLKKIIDIDEINFEQSFTLTFGKTPTEDELLDFTEKEKTAYGVIDPILIDVSTLSVEEDELASLFMEYGNKLGKPPYNERSFLGKLSKIEEQFNQKRNVIEQKISEELSKKIKSPNVGLGFNPTIKNVLAVICASSDAFMRLMDDVHEDAWEQRSNPVRLTSIIDSQKAFNIENKDAVETVTVDGQLKNTAVVYPWPHYLELQKDEEGNEEYVAMYPGDSTVSSKTQAYDSSIWPEIKFVEEYLKAAVQREDDVLDFNYPNEGNQISYLTPAAIEFPFENRPYINLSEVSFYYEIMERTMINSTYTRFLKNLDYQNEMYSILGEIEYVNINEATKNSPEITKKLKETSFSYDSFVGFLNSISLYGSWNLFSRDEYVTQYLKNLTEKDYGIYDYDYVSSSSVDILGGGEVLDKLENFLNSNSSDEVGFLDVYPFNNIEWAKENMSLGINLNTEKDVIKTKIGYRFLSSKKVITSFTTNDDFLYDKKVFTNFHWTKNYTTTPDQVQQNVTDNAQQVIDVSTHLQARDYFLNRGDNKFFITESFVNYGDSYDTTKNNLTNSQTTSLLNTPYFVNALLKGVENKKNEIENPYVGLGYLYLNSLPLSTLREELKTFASGTTTTNGYISSTLNKFSSLHSQPYYWILKYGSIWYRYKKYQESEIDILDDIWKDFDYINNYDPQSGDITKSYVITNDEGNTINYQHKYVTVDNINNVNGEFVIINSGIYPKVINDLYYYFTNVDVFNNYSEDEFSNAYNNKKLRISRNNKGKIFKSLLYDTENPDRLLSFDTWFGYFETKDNSDFENFDKDYVLVIPSNGDMKFNQAKFECFREYDGKITLDIIDNPSVYNGSVRTLWSAPNYGFYDNNMIRKPEPDEYIKNVKGNSNNTQPFDLNNNEYSSIEDIFGVFTKDMLDSFEKHFLNFCKEPDKVDSSILSNNEKSFDEFLINVTRTEGVDKENLTDEDLFRYQSLYKNNANIYKTDEKTDYFNITLHDVMKKLFLVEKPKLTDLPEQNAENIAKNQMKKFVNAHKYGYLQTQSILKIGNPGKYNRKVFKSFSNDPNNNPVDKLNFGEYEPNSLPTNINDITLIDSKTNYPEEWNEMYQYVGFSDIDRLSYSDNGSYLTDFFVVFNVKFEVSNIRDLHQIIKIYATKKLQNSNYNTNDFYNDLNKYLFDQQKFHENILNDTFIKLNRNLPSVRISENNTIISSVDGNVPKIDSWETFRLMNDKWVAGQDFKNRTIFEDFLFLDRANRPVGDKVVINIENLRTYLKGRGDSLTVYQLVGHLLQKNNFTFMPTPVYTNFYGRNERVKEGEPIEQSRLGDDLFGTFMEVDTRETRPRMLAIYTGKPSENLDDGNYPNSRRLDDAFDMTRASDCPLIENQTNKKNYSDSNKCVGFNVDFGTRNQGIFSSMSLDMNTHKNIGPTFQVVEDLGSMASQQKVAQQSQSLYNFYKSKSYTCNITSMGNAMIQPTMYFNLRHVPMFTGPYLVIEVNHTITPNNFETNFRGIRIPKYSLQVPDKLVMSVNKEILKTFQEKLRAQRTEQQSNEENNNGENRKLVKEKNKPVDNSSCEENNQYSEKPFVTQVETVIPKNDIVSALNTYQDTGSTLKKFVYGIALIENNLSGGNIKCFNNNIFNVKTNTTEGIGNKKRFFNSQICVQSSNGGTISMASFSNVSDSIGFMMDIFKPHEQTLLELIDKLSDDGISGAYTYLWAATWYNAIDANSAQSIIDNIGTFKNSDAYKTAKNYFSRAINNY